MSRKHLIVPEYHTLPAGLQMVHQRVRDTRLVHLALVINTGSRDERPQELGMAHFLEHMLFKGTHKRRAYHILSRIDNVGGELDAFTTREKTCLSATVTREYLDRALELLLDMAFHSTLPEAEMGKEKAVIAEEIDMYEDTPEDSILEAFDALVFPGHTLGAPILGTRKSLAGISRDMALHFYHGQYRPDNMVLSVAGNLAASRVLSLLQKYPLLQHTADYQPPARTAPAPHRPVREVRKKPVTQAHYILGGRAYALQEAHYVPWLLLNSYLGGPAMNNRLSLSIREKYGLSYNIYSFYTPYTDRGIWGVYAATDAENIPRLQALVHKELQRLMQEALSPAKVAAIRKQYAGNLVMAWENSSARMMGLANDLLDGRKPYTLEEALQRIHDVTGAQMQQAAIECFAPDSLSELVYLPRKAGAPRQSSAAS
ncbi:MAG: insulinase family protein [Bacteroidetes bacterium]|nr:insulinase family protein [Bacteroidota bacterium]